MIALARKNGLRSLAKQDHERKQAAKARKACEERMDATVDHVFALAGNVNAGLVPVNKIENKTGLACLDAVRFAEACLQFFGYATDVANYNDVVCLKFAKKS